MTPDSPSKRRLLVTAGALGAGLFLCGHTPFRQWVVLRQRFLLIHTNREDMGTDRLGDKLAASLLEQLPSSRARVVRGPDNARIGSLMATDQADVAVFSKSTAAALAKAAPPFGELPATALRVLVEDAEYQLVCRESFPRHHGYLVAEALQRDADSIGIVVPDRPVALEDGTLPTHAGALAFLRGEPLEPS